jgi:hypothetical protein
MLTLLEILFVLCLLALAAILTGRALSRTARIEHLGRTTPEALAVCAQVGTGCWSLLYGYGAYLDLPAPRAVWIWGAGMAFLLLPRRSVALPRWRPGWLLPLACLILLGVAGNLLPIGLGNCYSPYNDTWAYLAASEALQFHGFRAPPALDGRHPTVRAARDLHRLYHRMGAQYLLALSKTLLPAYNEFELYPILLSWGLALNLAGIYTLGRWCLRLKRPFALAATFLAAVAINPLHFTASNGFYNQLFGTANLLFALAILARVQQPRAWNTGGACLLGLIISTQMSFYGELTPFVGLAALVCCARAARRARRRGQGRLLLLFGFKTLLTVTFVANYEIFRNLHALAAMVGLQAVGWHHSWSFRNYWTFVMGVRGYDIGESMMTNGAVVLATLCLLQGLGHMVKSPQTMPLAACLSLFGCLTVFYAGFARDPWTHLRGHTWNLVKLCMWMYPFTLGVQLAGAQRLWPHVPWRRPLVTLLALGCFAKAVHGRVGMARQTVNTVQRELRAENAFVAVRQLRQQVAKFPDTPICILNRSGFMPLMFLLDILYPHVFVNDKHPSPLETDVPGPVPPDTLCLLQAPPPFGNHGEPWPMGVTRLLPDGLYILQFDSPDGFEPGGGGIGHVGTAGAEMILWAPRPGTAILSFDVQSNSPRSERVEVTSGGRTVATLGVHGPTPARIELELQAGGNMVKLKCLAENTNTVSHTVNLRNAKLTGAAR